MAGSNLLQLFWDLSSLKEKTRIEAATKLLQRLDQSKEDNSELDYCVKRLVSGLASNRKGARQGYFIALCEILSRYSEVTVDHVLSLVHDKLECIGNVKAAEERGAYFGQIFALLALIQSKRLTQPENVKSVVQKLAAISKKKIHLREFCAVSITQLLEGVDQEVIQSFIPYLELECGWEKCTPEILLIIISLQSKYGGEAWFQKLITMHWGDVPNILSSDYFKHISPILLLSSSTHPHIHSVWSFIIDQLRRGKDWTVFWSTIIDDCLLTSTYERKFLAYQVIEQFILPTMTVNEVGVVLSPTLLRTLKTSTHVPHHVLYEASQHVLDQLVQCTSKNQVLNVGVWLHLLNGNQFKVIAAKLSSQLSVGGVAEYAHYLITDQRQDTHWILQQISMLLKSVPRNLKHSDWLHPLAQHVLVQAYYVTEPQFATREIFQEKLVAILTELCNLNLTGKNQSFDIWSVTMLKELEELDSLSLISEMTEEEKEVWQESVQLILSLKDKEERDDHEKMFLYLLSLSTLEMIWDREVAPTTTEELLTCYKNMMTSLTKTPIRGRRKSKAPPTDPDWIEVLTDIMLSLLSRSQQIWRITVERAFHLMMKYMTPNTMQLIVKALETHEVDDLMEVDEKEDTNSDDDDVEIFHDPSAEFLADVRNALGDLVHSDQESVSSMDEEDMEALDEALASVFRKRQNTIEAKKQNKADETSVMHFKMRVLDLMEQFIRYQSTNVLVLELLQPLFQLVTQLQGHKVLSLLADKANNVLEKLCRVKAYPREGLDVCSLHSLLEQLITSHLYKAKKLTIPIVTQLSMFLIRLLRGTHLPFPKVSPMMTRSARKRKLTISPTNSTYGGLLVDNLTQWCSAALTHMITVKNSNVPMGFFQSYCERQPELGWKLLPTLISSLKSPGNHFKQIQGYTLVTVILHRSNKLEEDILRSDLIDLAGPLQDQCVLDLTSSSTTATYKIILECIDLLLTILKSHDELIDLVNKDLLLTTFNELMSNQTLPTKISKQISKLSIQVENDQIVPPKRKKQITY